LEEEARRRQLSQGDRGQEGGRGNSKPGPKGLGDGSGKHDGEAAEQAAKMFDTNRTYVLDVSKLQKNHPDLYAKVLAGALTVPAAMREAEEAQERAEREANEKARASEAEEEYSEQRDVSELLSKATRDFEEVARALDESREEYNRLCETELGVFLPALTGRFTALKRKINGAKPTRICVTCRGHGCDYCKGTGVVPKS
jgi:hypothetical protein